MSERVLVNWGLARRVAGGLAGVEAGTGIDPGVLRAACSDALAATTARTGLDPGGDPPAPELVGRSTWAANALHTLALAARPLEQRVVRDLAIPAPLARPVRGVMGAAAGIEAGLATGYVGRRVLAQYDVALVGPRRRGRLLFVGPNLTASARELGVEAERFLRWVALHEVTHVIQFEAVPWLLDHVRGLLGELLESAGSRVDMGTLAGLGRRLLDSDPRELFRATVRGELVRALADRGTRERLDRLQATMSVLEGHAEHLMDACAADAGLDATALRAGVEARRARRGGLGEIVARILGLDLKLRQYEAGKKFCDAVTASGGEDALDSLWRGPGALPDLAELERPDAWLARVAADPAPAL